MRYRVIKRRGMLLALALAICVGGACLRGLTRAVQTAAGNRKHPIYSVETDEKVVALGINCAWGNEDIPALLQALEECGVRATFFVVGDWCERYPESVKAIHDAGHEVGSHSDTHPDMTKLDREGMRREIRESARKIEAVTGESPTLFRPPSGAYNATVVEVIASEGMYAIQWDCDSLDYRDLTVDEMQNRIFKKLRKGSILLFHSGAKNTPTALPQIIHAIQGQNYAFKPVSELIHKGSYTVDFEGRQHPA